MFWLAAIQDTGAYEWGYRIGAVIGVILTVVLFIGIPIFFIVSLVQAIRHRSTGWIISAVISGVLLLIPLAGIAVGVLRSVTAYKEYSDSDQTPMENRTLTSGDGICRITIPAHWKPLKNLNELAGIQAGNLLREEYLIIISERRQDFTGGLSDYAKIILDQMKSGVEGYEQGVPEATQINGRPALSCAVTGSVDKMRVVYQFTFVEGESCYHQIMGWTLASKASKAIEVIKQTSQTFQEISPAVPVQ
jgi:heme/copper-type cytochrome/quinol oxidase subunit 2